MFLARYLAENKFPKNIAATMLVSSPHTAEMEQSLADFIIPKDLKLFEKQGGKIFLYYSSDDPFIGNALDHMEAYRKSLPKAIPRTFSDRGHFLIEKFPEIIEDIRNL
jgi:pimeloyl-ACP methyl ester carboxylesterase